MAIVLLIWYLVFVRVSKWNRKHSLFSIKYHFHNLCYLSLDKLASVRPISRADVCHNCLYRPMPVLTKPINKTKKIFKCSADQPK